MKAPVAASSTRGRLALTASRIAALLLATLAGWAVALVATLPMQFTKIQGNAVGDWSELLSSLAAGAAIWCLWSFAFTVVAAFLGGVPLILLMREEWLLRHPRASSTVAALLGWSVVLVKFEFWEQLLPEHTILGRLFFLYSLLFSVSCGVAAAIYLRIVPQIRKRETTA